MCASSKCLHDFPSQYFKQLFNSVSNLKKKAEILRNTLVGLVQFVKSARNEIRTTFPDPTTRNPIFTKQTNRKKNHSAKHSEILKIINDIQNLYLFCFFLCFLERARTRCLIVSWTFQTPHLKALGQE